MGASPAAAQRPAPRRSCATTFVFTGACVMPLPELLIGGAGEHFDQDGNLTDPAVRAALVELIEALRVWTLRIEIGEAAA